ncbi:MAG: hypothetical protein ABH831_00260 [Candidatus Nealsonbacteria bacterium]
MNMYSKYLIAIILLSLVVFAFPKGIHAQSATIYFSPSTGSFTVGETFSVKVMVNTAGEAVNVVGAYFSYPTDKVDVLSVDTSGSELTIWAEKEAVNGQVKLAGGLPTPGISGIKKVASISFKVKASGSLNLQFSGDSAVITDVGNQNILNLTNSGKGSYTLKGKTTVPPSVPKDPNPPKPPVLPVPPKPIDENFSISEVLVTKISKNSATISWKTNEDASSTVEYGETMNFGFSIYEEDYTKEHSLIVSDLLPGSSYYFKIKSQTEDGEETETGWADFSTLGYEVEVMVLTAEDNLPISGAKVSFSDRPQLSGTTGIEGIASFDGLGLGQQRISIEKDDVLLNYHINVLNKEAVQTFKIVFDKGALTENVIFFLGVGGLLSLFSLFLVLKTFNLWFFKAQPEENLSFLKPSEEGERKDNLPPQINNY